ncbi:hypothetical protein [Rhodoligotrophos ferricapiens]|uniref:hypothetical protein n=1 Tax=Rhodoligotrophos ferricapiens TaxID=3069264 RepID=UPI00315D4EAD
MRGRCGALAALITVVSLIAAVAPSHAGGRAVVGVTPEGETCFLGGADGANFIAAEQIVPSLGYSQAYTLITLSGTLREVSAVGPAELTETGDCEASYGVELALEDDQPGVFAVAVSGHEADVKSLLPKALAVKEPDERARQVLTDHLKAAGIAEPELKFKQVLSVDLDGDGQDELVINAARIGNDGAVAGDYSVLLVAGREKVIPIRSDVVAAAEASSEEQAASLLNNQIVAILDIDADGKYEIVTYSAFDFGDGWDAAAIRGDRAEHVLWCGCGG